MEQELSAIGTKLGLSRHQVGTKLASSWHQVISILEFCRIPQSIQKILTNEDWKDRTKFRNKYINPLLELDLLQMTIPDKPNSPKQKYYLTSKGVEILKILKENM